MVQSERLIFLFMVIIIVVLWEVDAISNVEPIAQNAITDEERRGGVTDANRNVNHEENSKKQAAEPSNDKKTRGIHSTSASHKSHHYFVPSGYDSQIAATGHGGGGGGAGYSIGSTSGYDFVGHGSTGPSGSGHQASSGHSGHSGHHGTTGYASGSGYGASLGGGYGLVQGYGGHGHNAHAGGQIGHSGIGGHGHSVFGGHGNGHGGGIHSALALKSLLIPLAGIALLGAAAALSTNPVLLQLGVVNGRRRRRSTRNLSTSAPSLNSHYPANPHVRPDIGY